MCCGACVLNEDGLTRRLLCCWHLLDSIALAVLCITALLWGNWIYQPSRTATFTMNVPSALLPRDGFYNWEKFARRPGGYQWTEGHAQLALPNLGGIITLQMVMMGRSAGSTSVQMQVGTVHYTFAV